MVKSPALALAAIVFLSGNELQAQQVFETDRDTKLRASAPDQPGGSAGWLNVNSSGRALLGFTLDSLERPVTAELEVTTVSGAIRQPGTVEVVEVVSAWDEASATWNSMPMAGRIVGILQVPMSSSDTTLSIEVTDIVNDWLLNPGQNFGLMLRSVGGTDVAFRSRESQGGTKAARLTVMPAASPPAAVTRVVVAADDGDYADIPTAADNAHSGDQWCDRSSGAMCEIHVRAGLYTVDRTVRLDELRLIGDGRESTRISAAPGVVTVVEGLTRFRSNPGVQSQVSDLSIVNRQRDVEARGLTGFVSLARVDLSVAGSGAVGMSLVEETDSAESFDVHRIADSSIDVDDGTRGATGISGFALDVTDSRIAVTGSRATGILGEQELSGDITGPVSVTRSSISVIASERASAVTTGGIVLRDSQVQAEAPQARGLSLGTIDVGPFTEAMVSNSTVTALAGDAAADSHAMSLGGIQCFDAQIDNATLIGPIALDVSHWSVSCQVSISASRLIADAPPSIAARFMLDFASDELSAGPSLTVNNSILTGTTSIQGLLASALIGASQVDGSANLQAGEVFEGSGARYGVLRCVNSWDAEFNPLDEDCNSIQ